MSGRAELGRGCALACERASEGLGKGEREGKKKESERGGGRGGEGERGREEWWRREKGGGGKRMNTPMLIGDGTSVLVCVFLVRRSSLAH